MKYWLTFLLITFFTSSHTQNVLGNWYGHIDTEEGVARAAITIYQRDGKNAAFITIPEFFGIGKVAHFDSIVIDKSGLFLSCNKNLQVSSTLINDSIIKGRYTSIQPALSTSIELQKVKDYPDLKRPQTPVAPFPYASKPVSYYDAITKIKYEGVLSVPAINNSLSGKVFPAIILFAGSGMHDKNYTAGAHETFTVLADYLTRNGYAVLRNDSRGKGNPNANAEQITLADLAADGEAAVRFLKQQPNIDISKIGLLGHSEGGLVAPLTALNNHNIKFIILLAAPAIPWKKILYNQILIQQKEQYKNRPLPAFLQDTAIIYKSLEMADSSPRTAYLLQYDAANTLSKLTIPVLALNGDKDLQTKAEENIGAIEEALRKSGNKHYKTMILPGINHSLQKCIKCTYSENIFLEETISPTVLNAITDWLKNIW